MCCCKKYNSCLMTSLTEITTDIFSPLHTGVEYIFYIKYKHGPSLYIKCTKTVKRLKVSVRQLSDIVKSIVIDSVCFSFQI